MISSTTPVRRAITIAATLAFAGVSQAELHPRLDGAAAYDDVLDVTWLTDAGFSGSVGWNEQLAWVSGLNAANHLGYDDWRLASMSVAAGLPTGMASEVVDCSTIWQPLCADNELGYMFFHNLGGSVGDAIVGDRTVGDVTLTNIQARYWSATESGVTNAWMYHFDIGFGVWSPKNGQRHAWAVRDGDVLGTDSDGDGVADTDDNCTLRSNADQRDTNGDGLGNACDADLNADCIVNALDLGLFRTAFFCADAGQACRDADFNGDGIVNAIDLGVLKTLFFAAPGPSGVPNACSAT